MQTDFKSPVQKPPTFIEIARRQQIVTAAIQTIASVGYSQASLARIAQRAGISKGVIGYHFAGKDELIGAIVAEVLERAEGYMRPLIETESTGSGMLRAYIEANLGFIGAYREHLIAIVEIARNGRRADGSSRFDRAPLHAGTAQLSQLLARFQASGEFRSDFDPDVMASTIRAAIDAVPPRLAAEPDLDVEHYGRQLADLFDYATRQPTAAAATARRRQSTAS